jgi:hypothetical protein|tara:strand:- start:579 stop:689 length:111 start_codon:yes stop_codon:yes gene_type:complete
MKKSEEFKAIMFLSIVVIITGFMFMTTMISMIGAMI